MSFAIPYMYISFLEDVRVFYLCAKLAKQKHWLVLIETFRELETDKENHKF